MAIKSVVLGLFILVMWGRSYFVADTVSRGSETQFVSLSSAKGVVITRFVHDGLPTKMAMAWKMQASGDPAAVIKASSLGSSPWNRAGFGYSSMRTPGTLTVDIFLPHWFVFLLAMPSAVIWVTRRLLGMQTEAIEAWCPACAMNVSAKANRCPQCGGLAAGAETLEPGTPPPPQV